MTIVKAYFVITSTLLAVCFGQLNLTETEKNWLKNHPVIKVANEDDWPPFDYSEKGKALGLTISYTDLIADKLGIRFEYVNGLKWEELLERGKNKQIDLMPCLWYSKDREEYFWYTKPYISNPVVIVTNKQNKSVAKIEDLKSRKVAFIDGYVIKDQILKACPHIEAVIVQSPLEALLLVNLGSVDAYIDSLGMVSYQIENNLLTGLQIAGRLEMDGVENINNLYMGVRKDWPEFHGILQKALDAISEEEKLGMHNRWLLKIDSDSKGKFMVLPSEKKLLDKMPDMKLAVQENLAPISYGASTGKLRGIVEDYIKDFEQKISKQFQRNKVADPLISLKSNMSDLAVAIQEENIDGIVFSEPFLSLPVVAVTTKKSPLVLDLSVLENQKIGLVKGEGLAQKIKDSLPSAKLLYFNGISEALEAVNNGTISTYIGDMATSNYYIQRFNDDAFKVTSVSGVTVNYCLAMKQESSELLSVFDRYLSSVSDKNRKDIEHRWLNIEVEQQFDLSHYWQVITMFVAIILLILGGFVFWNRSLSREISERMKVEASLVKAREVAEQSNQAKSDFLAVMSHEIRTPLNGIIGMSQILEDSDLTPEQKKQCKVIVESGESLLTIINDILDFSKISAGKMQLENLPFNIEELCSSVVHLYEQMAREKDIELSFQVNLKNDNLGYLGDVVRLRQVLLNLVNNSLKFTNKGSVLLVVDKCDQDEALKIAVRDTGIGISEENLSKLFNKFSQADSSTTRKFGGTGLGLAICRNLVELMGGKISCESILGEGSCFKIDLKLEKSKLKPKIKTENNIELGSIELDVLLVEDNIVNQKIAEKLLKNLGCKVRVAEDGLKAIESLKEFMPDLVFMDCHMPAMDGYEATRQIRNDERYKSLPIVALTANATQADRDKCMKVGMNDFLAKPFNKDVFTRIIYEYSRKKVS